MEESEWGDETMVGMEGWRRGREDECECEYECGDEEYVSMRE